MSDPHGIQSIAAATRIKAARAIGKKPHPADLYIVEPHTQEAN